MYWLSIHARERIKKRKLKVEWLLAALNGRRCRLGGHTVLFCDPSSLCALVIDTEGMRVITALRLTPAKYERYYKGR